MSKTREIELARIRIALKEAFKAVEEEFSITLKLGNITYDDNSFRAKLISTNNTKEGKTVTQEALNFKKRAHFYGLNPADLGKLVVIQGMKYIITGLNPRNTKYPILCTSISKNIRYKFSADAVRSALITTNSKLTVVK